MDGSLPKKSGSTPVVSNRRRDISCAQYRKEYSGKSFREAMGTRAKCRPRCLRSTMNSLDVLLERENRKPVEMVVGVKRSGVGSAEQTTAHPSTDDLGRCDWERRICKAHHRASLDPESPGDNCE